jgi:hypothetical protein
MISHFDNEKEDDTHQRKYSQHDHKDWNNN